MYTYRRGLRRCSFNSTGQCEGLGAWDEQQVESCAFLFCRVVKSFILWFGDSPFINILHKMKIFDFLKNLINVLLDGSFERVTVINQMNQAFHEYFVSGDTNRLCKASISQGDPDFRHEMSAMWLRSGFKISIENDYNLKDSEIMEISQYVLENKAFIRQLMAQGFDTLIIKGKTTGKGKAFSLKAYANLNDYFIS